MNIKIINLFYFIVFVFFQFFYPLEVNLKNLNKLTDLNKNTIDLLDTDSNRILSVLDILDFFEKNNYIIELQDSASNLFKFFFGLNISQSLENICDKQYFIESIIFSINKFNSTASSDLKYLCDMQIKYILSLKKIVLKKIKKSSIYSIIVLSYCYYLFFTNDYIDLNVENESDSEEDVISEKEVMWQEAALQLPLEIAELGLLNNGYLYELFDSYFISKLNSNKDYKNILLTHKILPDSISKDDLVLERLMDRYKLNLDFFKMNLEIKNLYNEKEEFFLMWLLEKKNIIDTLDKFLNEDALFMLFTIVLLYKSISKIDKNYYYSFLDNEFIKDFEKISLQAEFIIYNFLNIFDKKMKINWDALPIIIIKESRLREITEYIKILSIM